MELTVYWNNAEFGTLSCKQTGKSLSFDGNFALSDGIYRLYAISRDEEILPLGVLLPERRGFALHRALRRKDAGELLQKLTHAVICPGDTPPQLMTAPIDHPEPEPELLPEPPADESESAEEPPSCARLDRWLETDHPEQLTEDPILQKTLMGAEGALYRYHLGCIELALPEEAHAHLAPALTIVRAGEIRGAHCFILTFGPNGLPRPADTSSID